MAPSRRGKFPKVTFTFTTPSRQTQMPPVTPGRPAKMVAGERVAGAGDKPGEQDAAARSGIHVAGTELSPIIIGEDKTSEELHDGIAAVEVDSGACSSSPIVLDSEDEDNDVEAPAKYRHASATSAQRRRPNVLDSEDEGHHCTKPKSKRMSLTKTKRRGAMVLDSEDEGDEVLEPEQEQVSLSVAQVYTKQRGTAAKRINLQGEDAFYEDKGVPQVSSTARGVAVHSEIANDWDLLPPPSPSSPLARRSRQRSRTLSPDPTPTSASRYRIRDFETTFHRSTFLRQQTVKTRIATVNAWLGKTRVPYSHKEGVACLMDMARRREIRLQGGMVYTKDAYHLLDE